MEHCAKCQTCSDACHIYEESGKNPLYRPTYRSEILRRIYYKYIKNESRPGSTATSTSTGRPSRG